MMDRFPFGWTLGREVTEGRLRQGGLSTFRLVFSIMEKRMTVLGFGREV